VGKSFSFSGAYAKRDRTFYLSGARDKDPRGGKDMYVDLEMQMRDEGNRHPGADDIPSEMRPIIDPRTGEQARNPVNGKLRYRPVKTAPAALGFSSEDFHYAGDRIVTLNEEVEVKGGQRTGRILHHFQRVDDQGRSLGTYEQAWESDSRKEGRMRSAGKARRYYSMG
jgi:hypothetical protein